MWAPERRVLTVALVANITLIAFESISVATAMPEVADDLGGIGLYGWVFSAYMLGNLVGIVVAGRRADASGPAPPFAMGLLLFAVGLVVAGFAPSMPVLVAARLVQGLGGGAVPATAYVTIARAFPESLRPRMMAVLSSAWVMPAIAGPAVAGVITETVGWRWVFLGLLPIVAVSGTIAVRALGPLGPPPDANPVDPRGIVDAIRVAGGAALVLAAITAPSILSIPAAASGVMIGSASLRRLLPRGVMVAAGPLAAAVAARFAINFVFFGAEAFVPFTLNEIRGTSTSYAGLPLTASALGWASGAWLQARRATTWGARRLATTGACALAVGTAGMLPVANQLGPPATAIMFWGVAGLGMGLVYPTISVLVLRLADPGSEGAAASSMQLADNLGFALGTGLSGAAVALAKEAGMRDTTGVSLAFVLPLAMAGFGIFAAARFPRTRENTQTGITVGYGGE